MDEAAQQWHGSKWLQQAKLKNILFKEGIPPEATVYRQEAENMVSQDPPKATMIQIQFTTDITR